MKFKTTLAIEKQGIQLEHQSGIILIGSCFTEHIGLKLRHYKFDSLRNPFGTVFHPVPIAWLIEKSMEQKKLKPEELDFDGSLYFHDQFHYRFSSPNQKIALDKMNNAFLEHYEKLKDSTCLFISLGSAIGYSQKEKNIIVANCHKQDSKSFQKEFSELDFLHKIWSAVIEKLRDFNPKLQIVFTISPVRHIRDGIIQSARSKALLNVFVHRLIEQHSHLHYFPSFELLMDDLRDYRFYDDDLIHPGNLAVEYIWEGFCKAYFSDKTTQLNKAIDSIQKAKAHKIQHAGSKENKVFVENQLKKIEAINQRYPEIDLGEEFSYFKRLIDLSS